MKDFTVSIAKQTRPISKDGFATPLILGTSKKHAFKVYRDIESVLEDFAETTKEYKIAKRMFEQDEKPSKIYIYGIELLTAPIPDQISNDLNNLVEVNNDWYILTCTDNSDEVISALSEWIKDKEKIYFTTTQNLELPGTIKVENAVVAYHDDSESFLAEGLAAIAATNEVGSITFKFRTIKGINEANIKATELRKLHENGSFSYVKKAGILQTSEGITTTGEYIDVVMGDHFIKIRMEQELAILAHKTKKIGYADNGIALIVDVAQNVLQEATSQGIILKDNSGVGQYKINMKSRAEMSHNDIATRNYGGVTFEAKLEGAIHSGNVSGTLQY